MYELQSNCCTVKASCLFFYCTNCLNQNKIILLCEDLIEFLFSFLVAVSFLLLPKRSSEGLFLVSEPAEMVTDVIYIQAHQKGYNRVQYKRHRGLYLMLVNSNSTQSRLTNLWLTVHSF